jgi:hypothetical protein
VLYLYSVAEGFFTVNDAGIFQIFSIDSDELIEKIASWAINGIESRQA